MLGRRFVKSAKKSTAGPNLSGKSRNGARSVSNISNVSSASATPTGEEDEDGNPKRSTRGRNPLPPSSGPLFPPLPPKQPKPKAHTSTSSTSMSTSNAPDRADSPTNSEKPDIPSTSNASLTPPPPGSEGAVAVEDAEVDAEEHGDLEPVFELNTKPAEVPVKDEEEEIDDEEVDRTPRQRTLSSSRAKRRRGEEALLLDDHLLPPELRRHRKPSSKKGYADDLGDEKAQVAPREIKYDEDDQVIEYEDEEVDNEEQAAEDGDQDGDDLAQDITRCVCQRDDTDEMMIQCDQCNVWQHGPCMGIWGDDEAPDEYYCELCRPDLHGPLKRWIRRFGRNRGNYVAPREVDLSTLNGPSSKIPPSQSKRWTDPDHPNFKPTSRSHHKKEVASPVEPSAESQRPPRRPPPAATTGSTSKRSHGNRSSLAEDKDENSAKPTSSNGRLSGKRQSSIGGGHKDSVSPGRSLSPSATLHHAARRRITMNSRDAMYEEEVRAAMEASRREALGLPPAEDEAPEEAVEEEEAEKEKKEPKKGKRKRDDDESVEPNASSAAASATAASKIKHPNQYTYRPKPASASQPAVAVSPARRGAGTPVPSIAPPQHDHGTRRAGAIANGAIAYPTLSASSVAALSWYLPEHLSAFSDLLPTPQPVALDVRSQRTLPSISRNHYHNQRYGPFSETRDENGKLLLPEDPPLREPAGEPETHLEPPARVKYPVKRITVGEMRKRVRSILEYVSKVQGTDEKRIERNKTLGIVVTPLPKKQKPAEGEEAGDGHGPPQEAADGDGDIAMKSTEDLPDTQAAPGQEAEAAPTIEDSAIARPTRSSTELLEELTRDLLAFQETFAANGLVSPMPPPIATFEPPLSIPVPDVDPDSGVQTEDTTVMSEVADEPVVDSTMTSADGLEPSAKEIETTIGDPSNRIGEGVEVVDQVPADQAVDVYREGQVDQVVSQPGEEAIVSSSTPAEANVDIAPAIATNEAAEEMGNEATDVSLKATVPPLSVDEIPTSAVVEEPTTQQDTEMVVDPVV